MSINFPIEFLLSLVSSTLAFKGCLAPSYNFSSFSTSKGKMESSKGLQEKEVTQEGGRSTAEANAIRPQPLLQTIYEQGQCHVLSNSSKRRSSILGNTLW